MIGAEIIFNEKEAVTIGTYNSQPLITQQSDRKKMKARYEQLKDELKKKGLIK